MNTKLGLFAILSISLLISIGVLTINTAFAQDSQNSDGEEQENKIKDKSQTNEEKRKELEEKRREIEKKREELESDREKLNETLSERTEKYEQKLTEIKEKYQKKIDDLSEKNSKSLKKSEERIEKLEEKSEKIQERLKAKSEKLDSRIQKILEKIDDGDYMGKKIGSSKTINTYELVFDSISASAISNQSEISTMTGKMTFTTYDSSKSNLKLELESCSISVGDIPYVCGYGKARTASSGDSGSKDSLVIIAFLEDDLAEELHSTLKIFLDSDIPIDKIDQSEVSVLGPQSKISHLWFLDGTATLTKIVTDTTDDPAGNEITIDLTENVGIAGN
ncbi:MAG: hypothetical protein KC444_04500 [Nitrosopumilus sp.]|nr:hypothetical protein [Nitrosopumilus sp.]